MKDAREVGIGCGPPLKNRNCVVCKAGGVDFGKKKDILVPLLVFAAFSSLR
jgi:hypothetical protein